MKGIPEGDWFCERCKLSLSCKGKKKNGVKNEEKTITCCLCPTKEGAMKQTVDGRWAHIVCGLLVPEVFFKDPEGREGIDCSKVPKKRWPVLATGYEGGIKDWDSWYAWRKLPKRSPAALLMSFPLSVYQLLIDTLSVTTPASGKSDSRVSLCVHVLGL